MAGKKFDFRKAMSSNSNDPVAKIYQLERRREGHELDIEFLDSEIEKIKAGLSKEDLIRLNDMHEQMLADASDKSRQKEINDFARKFQKGLESWKYPGGISSHDGFDY